MCAARKDEFLGGAVVNIRVGLQYTGYLKFNGGTSNYDGFAQRTEQLSVPVFVMAF